MSLRKKVAVIGGGVSGLAAAKAFDERGHRVVGFERTHDLGGVWEPSRSYPDVQTQSPKDLYRYTDHPMPDDYPEWPKGPQVHAYLHAYAARHNTARLFRLNTSIRDMQRRADGKLDKQPSDTEMSVDIEKMLSWKRNDRPAAKIYGGLCSAPFHFRHFDELLADMGATHARRGLIAEQFKYPEAEAYGRFLASTPQYQAQ